MYGQRDCHYERFMWILLPKAFFTRQYGKFKTGPTASTTPARSTWPTWTTSIRTINHLTSQRHNFVFQGVRAAGARVLYGPVDLHPLLRVQR